MSAPKKSREFCTLDEDGEPSDLALHAGILEDEEITGRLDEEEPPGPGLSEEDETDISDLDDLDDLHWD